MTRLFRPLLSGATASDRLLACLAAAVGIAATAFVGGLSSDGVGVLIVAPMGASAVLVFAVPASPLAQPWPVVGGNIISALVGIAVAKLLGVGLLGAGVAVGLAIGAMSITRCLHPPGGAAALTAVIGGAKVMAAGWGFAFMPVGINALALLATGWAYHRFSRHSYPHRPAPGPTPRFAPEDLDAALAASGEAFDIAREDLQQLLAAAEEAADRRRSGKSH